MPDFTPKKTNRSVGILKTIIYAAGDLYVLSLAFRSIRKLLNFQIIKYKQTA